MPCRTWIQAREEEEASQPEGKPSQLHGSAGLYRGHRSRECTAQRPLEVFDGQIHHNDETHSQLPTGLRHDGSHREVASKCGRRSHWAQCPAWITCMGHFLTKGTNTVACYEKHNLKRAPLRPTLA